MPRSNKGKSGAFFSTKNFWCSFLTACCLSAVNCVSANPQNGVIVGGNANIINSPGLTQINQTSNKAIINWGSFNIGASEETRFNQPSSDSITLNRIDASQGASNILGKITANGHVWLINPAGIFFGSSAQVDAAGLIATTADIKNEDFMAGNYKFQQSSQWHAGIVNEGSIKAADHGLVALIAPSVINRGTIQANLGKVALAAGMAYTIDLYGDHLIHFGSNAAITQAGTDPTTGVAQRNAILHTGNIIANGGKVLITARAARAVVDNVINMQGVVEAKTAFLQNGEIVLSSGTSHGLVRIGGKLDVSGKQAGQAGGKINIIGERVSIDNTADIDATGNSANGNIVINVDLRNPGNLYIDPAAKLTPPPFLQDLNSIPSPLDPILANVTPETLSLLRSELVTILNQYLTEGAVKNKTAQNVLVEVKSFKDATGKVALAETLPLAKHLASTPNGFFNALAFMQNLQSLIPDAIGEFSHVVNTTIANAKVKVSEMATVSNKATAIPAFNVLTLSIIGALSMLLVINLPRMKK